MLQPSVSADQSDLDRAADKLLTFVKKASDTPNTSEYEVLEQEIRDPKFDHPLKDDFLDIAHQMRTVRDLEDVSQDIVRSLNNIRSYLNSALENHNTLNNVHQHPCMKLSIDWDNGENLSQNSTNGIVGDPITTLKKLIIVLDNNLKELVGNKEESQEREEDENVEFAAFKDRIIECLGNIVDGIDSETNLSDMDPVFDVLFETISKNFLFLKNVYFSRFQQMKKEAVWLKKIIELVHNYPCMQNRMAEITKQKRSIERSIKILSFSIDLANEDLEEEANSDSLKQEISEYQRKIHEKREELCSIIHESNEIRQKIWILHQHGFSDVKLSKDDHEVILSMFRIPELSPVMFQRLAMFSGSHKVFMGIEKQTKKQYVIKKYHVDEQTQLDNLKKEIKILQKVKHRNIVALEGYYMKKDHVLNLNTIHVVMPFYNGGDLKNYIQSQRGTGIPMDIIFWERIWRQLLTAIQHIHANNVIHCDITPENIFIEREEEVVRVILGDFDESCDSLSGRSLPKQVTASFKSDMYAFGQTIKDVMTSQELSELSSLQQLVNQCLSEDASQRPTASQALAHEFFVIAVLQKEEELQTKLKQIEMNERTLERKRQDIDSKARNVQLDMSYLQIQWTRFEEQQNQHAFELEFKRQLNLQKEKYLKQLEEKLQKEAQSQLTLRLPEYWNNRALGANFSQTQLVDVTNTMKQIIQELLDLTCETTTLGGDQQHTRLVVSQVFRVENALLFSLYNFRKQQILSYNDAPKSIVVKTMDNIPSATYESAYTWIQQCGLDRTCNEVYLWHGTTPETLNTIVEYGFDERVSNLSGPFGAGIYFAENSSKSDDSTTNEFPMLLSRVVLGRQIFEAESKGQSLKDHRRPPLIPNIQHGKERVFDSVHGKSNASSSAYNEYIVYDKNQCYPEFLIKYQRQ
ncbi:hypothetical protein C9374_000562 [Naegleria lovaniensis]|uniref:Poly [ADP-ribose] polymerase n=1 Tax=Naegleria lovaniensis TaxID=51637 RepID=A0AA88GXX7_NAELO|nr:uncharacterized protein C9374_000562 [Naegleria lovaniensis]KAG2388398.1 hypothetical protein C9374_000562 [Naegleria lovaniensis]